jgi:hypothetical protein
MHAPLIIHCKDGADILMALDFQVVHVRGIHNTLPDCGIRMRVCYIEVKMGSTYITFRRKSQFIRMRSMFKLYPDVFPHTGLRRYLASL